MISTSVASSSDAFTDKFDCNDRSGVTSGFLQGAYTISIDAAQGNRAIGTAPAITKTIRGKNAITDLGTITIPIQGQ